MLREWRRRFLKFEVLVQAARRCWNSQARTPALRGDANRLLTLFTAALLAGMPLAFGAGPDDHVPTRAPRTMVLQGRAPEFRAYCTTGEGARAFARIKEDFDREFLSLPFPAEPLTYGDPDPKKRSSDKADKWRAAQDTCGRVSGVAEAGTLIWLVTGEDKYLKKAKEFLLGVSAWKFAPDWNGEPVPGVTDINYNDEAHFRLWRKLPLIYDQLREQLSPQEKDVVLAHFKQRGNLSAEWIKKARVEKVKRNSLEVDPASHPVRFMSMTGLAGLALWDDLPEARSWWGLAYKFYRDQFSPWGGDDGGWAEGNAYWRGTIEHASFQDALIAIGDPAAYGTAFWQNTPYFALYNVQPYLHTIFGDTSNAGRFNLDPSVADFLEHMSRVTTNGYLRSYAALCTDKRPKPEDKGLKGLDRTYPTACEFLVRDFIVSGRPLPKPRPLSELPPHRFFKDVGWVSLHSALGKPDQDIHITFKSSPYGSFSHSHGDQNAFILNAYGEGLAINSAYREFHRSPFHQEWTWQTRSKNALLIDGLGQKPQAKEATGKITRFKVADRYVLATGDATVAYQSMQEKGRVKRVTRDLIFVDQRYVVLRDRVSLSNPAQLSWLLHAERNLKWDATTSTATIQGKNGALSSVIISPNVHWKAAITDQFPVQIDPKYTGGEAGSSYVTGEWSNQSHLRLDSEERASDFTIHAVLWPSKGSIQRIAATIHQNSGALEIMRHDGKKDYVRVDDGKCFVNNQPPSSAAAVESDTTSAQAAQAGSEAAEVAPEKLEGAETFIFRDLQPKPLRVHVFKPKGWQANGRLPALMFFFGGGWSKGTPDKSATWGKYAAGLGMVGICPDYRTLNRFNTTPAESVADARYALRWVQENAEKLGLDPARIVVGGNSAGGHLALWTAIAKAPAGSLEGESPLLKPAALLLFSSVSDTSPLLGYTPKRFGTNAVALSPIHQLDARMPPILAFHGDADTTVPQSQALALRDKLIAGGNTYKLVSVPGGDHSFSSQLPEWKDKSRTMVRQFLAEQGLLP